jgi:hypothetical protein
LHWKVEPLTWIVAPPSVAMAPPLRALLLRKVESVTTAGAALSLRPPPIASPPAFGVTRLPLKVE